MLSPLLSLLFTNVVRADAIRELIRGELSAEQAAKEFIKDVNASRSLDQAEMKLWRIWRLLADVTAKFPQYHDQLLDMTVAIHSLPSLQIQGEAAVKWEDLPILSQTWAETVFNCMFFLSLIRYASSLTAFNS